MFFKKKEKVTRPTEVDKMFKALKILECLGLNIRDIYANEEFINKARKNREHIDSFKDDMEGLLNIDTTFACWLDKKVFPNRIKGKKGVEGMMFGINFRKKRNT